MGKSVIVCTLCNRKFFEKSQFTRHKKSVHPETCHFTCKICGDGDRKFLYKNALTTHTEIYHKNPKFYHCLYKETNSEFILCDKVCRTLNNIKWHLIHKHKVMKISFKNISKWSSLYKVTEYNDTKSASEMTTNEQDPDEIVNILTDFDDQVSENTTFEIIDRKFTPDMDFEMGIEKISNNFQNLDQNHSESCEIIDRKFIPNMDFELRIEKISSNFQNLDQNEASATESESLLDNCDMTEPETSIHNDSGKIPKVSNLSTRLRRKASNRKLPNSSIKSSNVSTPSTKKSKRGEIIKTTSNITLRPRRCCVKKNGTMNSDTDFEENLKKVKIPESIIPSKDKPRVQVKKMDKKVHECKKCEKFYGTAKTLRHHNENIHCENEENFECIECGVKYRLKNLLAWHLKHSKAHREPVDKMSCPKCPGTSFSRVSNFKRHNMAVHEKVKFKCIPCAISYGRNDLLKKHLKTEMHQKMVKLNQS